MPTAAEAKATREEGAIVVTIVYDNYPYDERLKTAWGFGCVVTGVEKTILFDTGGDGGILLANMRACGIGPEEIDAVVLSHIHADHTGGLNAFLEANSDVRVYLPKVFPEGIKRQVRKAGAQLVETEGPCKVADRAWTTGILNGSIPEQGLYLKGPDGLIVITGCAHPGIVRMVQAATTHAGQKPRAVLGGFHMAGASPTQIAAVIEGLKGLGVRCVAPCHCSGDETRRLMKEAFGQGYLPSGVGARLVFETETDSSGNLPE
jgi:7,8-dihydropterin-6-yl-methyl-4-(beta-D-ribofuranosyl)aminobenzene 5'-phosphate synthase